MLPHVRPDLDPYTPLLTEAIVVPRERPPVTYELIVAAENFYQGVADIRSQGLRPQAIPRDSRTIDKEGWETGYLDAFYQRIRPGVAPARHRTAALPHSDSDTSSSSDATSSDSETEGDTAALPVLGPKPPRSVQQASLNRMISQENKGFQMLKKLGWAGEGSGLGMAKDSITEPILIDSTRASQSRGIGHGKPAVYAAPTEPVDPLDVKIEKYRQQQINRYSQNQRPADRDESG
ncbi:hypothetical protein H4R33_001083 [Dimargaris cristalligena]|nr:hypothetical protein H4R33_001083 [Dimargaris cristalligena]